MIELLRRKLGISDILDGLERILSILVPEPKTWLSPHDVVPKSQETPAELRERAEIRLEFYERQLELLKNPEPKFKKKPYSILRVSDEKAIDDLMKGLKVCDGLYMPMDYNLPQLIDTPIEDIPSMVRPEKCRNPKE